MSKALVYNVSIVIGLTLIGVGTGLWVGMPAGLTVCGSLIVALSVLERLCG